PVNRARTPAEVLDVKDRNKYVDEGVVNAMPRGDEEEVEVVFFKFSQSISDSDLDKEYELRGLKPADPYSLFAVNEADAAFADERPNATHWKDASGKWCYAAFDRQSRGERDVAVLRRDGEWGDRWWFAGLCK